jgi:hypothetical protein
MELEITKLTSREYNINRIGKAPNGTIAKEILHATQIGLHTYAHLPVFVMK